MKKMLRWVGSKEVIKDLILSKLPENIDTYVEPFAGSIAVGLDVKANKKIFNDFNISLISFWKAVQLNPEGLKERLAVYQEEYNALPDMAAKKEYYLAKREEFNRLKGNNLFGLDTAALFKLLNASGFSGMYRENSKGLYNIPFGQKKTITLVDEELFSEVSNNLANCSLKAGDFAACCDYSKLGEGDVAYFDSPYDSTFSNYNSGGFDKTEQVRLFELCKQLAAQGCKVVASNSNTDFIRQMYSEAGFTVEIIPVRHGLERQTVEEVLIHN